MVYIQAVGCGGHSTEKEGEAAVDMQLVAAEETEERGSANGEEEGRAATACPTACLVVLLSGPVKGLLAACLSLFNQYYINGNGEHEETETENVERVEQPNSQIGYQKQRLSPLLPSLFAGC